MDNTDYYFPDGIQYVYYDSGWLTVARSYSVIQGTETLADSCDDIGMAVQLDYDNDYYSENPKHRFRAVYMGRQPAITPVQLL